MPTTHHPTPQVGFIYIGDDGSLIEITSVPRGSDNTIGYSVSPTNKGSTTYRTGASAYRNPDNTINPRSYHAMGMSAKFLAENREQMERLGYHWDKPELGNRALVGTPTTPIDVEVGNYLRLNGKKYQILKFGQSFELHLIPYPQPKAGEQWLYEGREVIVAEGNLLVELATGQSHTLTQSMIGTSLLLKDGY